MWPEEDRIRYYFAATHRRATHLLHTMIQKIGSNPSLGEVIQLLDARHWLHEAYIVMEDKLDDFINFDTAFIDNPRRYTELTTLACTTGDSVDEALSMSTEYLSNVGDVDDIFQESMMVCIELSSRIVTLTDPEISIPRHETPDLLRTRIRLKRTLTRMEAHWKNLIQKVQSRDDKVVFLELQNLVQTARHTAENLRPCRDRGLAIPDPRDNQTTPNESESETDDIPTAEEWERTLPSREDHPKSIRPLICPTRNWIKLNAQAYDASRRISRAYEAI